MAAVDTEPVERDEAPRAQTPRPRDVAAVILAAGEGARLGQPSKPLAIVAGRSLLERAVATVRAVGIRRVIVVVGHESDAVERFVRARGLDVQLVENDRFSAGSGSSAVAGGQAAGRRFLLMMGDHVVEPPAIVRMLESRAPFAVAVDRHPAQCDLDEATKVRIVDGAVVGVARELEAFDAVDAGIFVCDRTVVETAEHALAAGEGTWNAVKRRWIADSRRLEAVDVSGLFWMDVDTPEDVRRAERAIVSRAAAKPADGLVSRRLNRPLSWRLSLVLVRAELSPTSVTLLSFAATAAAAVAIALGARWPAALVVGGLLVQLASVVDGCDGEVARATVRTSRFGALLDTILDRLGDVALVLALAIAAGPRREVWVAASAAISATLLVPFVKAAYEAEMHASFPPLRASLGRDARLLAIAVCAMVLQPLWALVAVAAVGGVEFAVRTARALRAASS